MPDTINWLHITDLHFGLDKDNWLWPRVKNDFFRDIRLVGEELAGWDLVIFTGDFTQAGEKEQFERLNTALQEIWQVLSKNGRTPELCVVPGNHDLVRPPTSALTKAVGQLWWTDPDVRKSFWRDENSEYRVLIRTAFENYVHWSSNLPVPAVNVVRGIIPGDFSATFKKGRQKLGLVGLNSTFLQLEGGDYKEKLDLHVSQLNAVCDGEPERWLAQNTINLLLTHHPPSWLAKAALSHFRQEIYPSGRFFAHLYGHQHEPESLEVAEAGAAPRRLRQAPSLFGLEQWGVVEPKKRIHGYLAGQFIFEGSTGLEKIWPRRAIERREGGLNLAPDHSFTLQKDDSIVSVFELTVVEERTSINGAPLTQQGPPEEAASQNALVLLDTPPEESISRERLAACPRLPQSAGSHHQHVRQEEQSQFEHDLRSKRCVWVVADWGTGKEGFLSVSVERFRTPENTPEVFHLRCDEAMDLDSWEGVFSQQFGMALQTFCGLVAQLPNAFLFVDGVHPELASGEQLHRLRRAVNAILDYAPALKVILSCRLPPDSSSFSIVELRPLDVPETRTYLTHHPDATPQIGEPDVIEKLHERSEGLPMHLDRMLRALKVSSLASVVEAEMESLEGSGGPAADTPKALVHAVSSMANSQDRSTQRSLRLLKVLSLLRYGETLETLRHYLPTEPFFPANAIQLSESALVDVIPLQLTSPSMRGITEAAAPKILKVPRQVRDYVLTIISEDEREEIVLAGLDRLFGRKWRDGNIKFRTMPPEYRDYLASGVGNEFALIHHLISLGKSKNEPNRVEQGTALAVQYAHHLRTMDRFRDLTLVGADLLEVLDREENAQVWAPLAALYGEGLRMLGKNDEALGYLKESLEVGEQHLSNDDKVRVWLGMALIEERRQNKEAAVAAAERVKSLTSDNSGPQIQALSVIAEQTLEGEKLRRRLTELEKKARSSGNTNIADIISLDLAAKSEKASDKMKHLDRILKQNDRGYNSARAIVMKANTVSEANSSTGLSATELVTLAFAYSYFYGQRFGQILDQAHRALWNVFESRGETGRLLRLFRHTSFLWRIRGEEEKEVEYLNRLEQRKIRDADETTKTSLVLEFRYYMRRFTAIIVHAITPKSSK